MIVLFHTKSGSYDEQMFNYRRPYVKIPMLLFSEVLIKILNKIQVNSQFHHLFFRLETLAKENQAKLKNQEFFWLSKLEAIHKWLEDTIKEFEEEKEPTEETLTSDIQKIGVRTSFLGVAYLIKFCYSSVVLGLKGHIFCGYSILKFVMNAGSLTSLIRF